MIIDLRGTGVQAASADVLIIGAGTCGLAMAVRLTEKGVRVLCLESGGMTQENEEHPLNDVVHLRTVYAGAAHGRFRCLGGTSTRWGGALIPFLPGDLAGTDWPIAHGEIIRYLPAVESFFGLAPGSYELTGLPEGEPAHHVARLAKWPPFAKRNVANLVSAEVRDENGPQIWLNATATNFEILNRRLVAVTARAADGSSIRVSSRQIIFAAGAIESTRLVWLMDQQNGGAIAEDDQLGRYFHDHLSVVVGHLADVRRKLLNQLVGFRFEKGGSMRNLRFELANNTPLRLSVPPCFAHIAFKSTVGSGFDSLRELFRRLQQGRPPQIKTLLRLAKSTPWLIRAAWWRFVEKRLLYPDDAPIEVHMVIEQEPTADSRITLSPTETDLFRLPKAEISWNPSASDLTNLARAIDAFEATWNTSQLRGLGEFVRRPRIAMEEDLRGTGIYHPCGSTRMAKSPDLGVIDKDLRLFHVPNVSVVATSVLPRSGGANPTMMLMMLAFRCADRVAKELTSEIHTGPPAASALADSEPYNDA